MTVTDRDLRGHVPAAEIRQDHGTFTWTIGAGSWHTVQKAPNPLEAPLFSGIYTVDGHRLHIRVLRPAEFLNDDVWAQWSYNGRRLVLSHVHGDYPDDAVLWGAHPWVRAG
jgi:hypothetical protein